MSGNDDNPGIIPLSIFEIFKQIENVEGRNFVFQVGYIEIYNEKIYDLMDAKKAEITKIHEGALGEVKLDQIMVEATSADNIMTLYAKANRARRIDTTQMNNRSNRSHTILKITIESREVWETLDKVKFPI